MSNSQNNPEKLMGLLGLAARAGKLVYGTPMVCEALKEKKKVYYHQHLLPALLWDSYTACYGKLMQEATKIMHGGSTQDVIDIIEAERFLWERLTDAPFGSMELIRADEALQSMNHAIFRVRRLEAEYGE